MPLGNLGPGKERRRKMVRGEEFGSEGVPHVPPLKLRSWRSLIVKH